MAKGWIYVLSNETFTGLLKVGYSDRDPTARIEELFTTGVPTPFIIEYYGLVEEAREVEAAFHKKAEKFRKNKSREFFALTVYDAVRFIHHVLEEQSKKILWEEYSNSLNSSSPRYRASPEDLKKMADDFKKIGLGEFGSTMSRK